MNKETFFKILNKGKLMKASDIHLLVDEVPIFRINGKLIKIEEYNILTEEDMKNLSSFVTNEEDKKILENEKELDFSFKIDNINCRINIFYEKKI